ncbi:phage portal protein [Hoeflea sp. CAU 1731]
MALEALRKSLASYIAPKHLEQKEAPNTFGLDWLLTPNTQSGPVVSPQSAMTVPAVKACVELIATSIGTMPVKVFKRLPDGSKEVATDHPAYRLVHRTANEYQSAGKLRQLLALDALLYGNGIAFPVRVDSRVIDMVRIDPRSVQITPHQTTGAPIYTVYKDQQNRKVQGVYSARDIIHIAAPTSFDGISGVSPVYLNREAIGLAITLEAHAARLFGNGAKPSGVLKFARQLTSEAIDRIRTSWKAGHSGSESGGTAILEEGADFQQLALSSVDAQFAEMRTAQGYEICRAFNMPPVMVGITDRATWGNAETQNRQYLKFCLRPWMAEFKSAYERQLLTEDEAETHVIDFVTEDLEKADLAARAESYTKLRSAGVITGNDARRAENLPALPDGDTLASPYTTSNNAPVNDNSPDEEAQAA